MPVTFPKSSAINGLGAAFRAKYMGTDQVSLVFLGDGAVNQGTFHESLNMASISSGEGFLRRFFTASRITM